MAALHIILRYVLITEFLISESLLIPSKIYLKWRFVMDEHCSTANPLKFIIMIKSLRNTMFDKNNKSTKEKEQKIWMKILHENENINISLIFLFFPVQCSVKFKFIKKHSTKKTICSTECCYFHDCLSKRSL